jgi:hypothetical protein
MDKWCSKSPFELFVKQSELANAIQDCHLEINDSITKLQVRSVYDIHLGKLADPLR